MGVFSSMRVLPLPALDKGEEALIGSLCAYLIIKYIDFGEYFPSLGIPASIRSCWPRGGGGGVPVTLTPFPWIFSP